MTDASPPGASRRRARRSWPQRLLLALNSLVLVGGLVGGSAAGYLYYRFGQLPRLSFKENVLAPRRPPGEPQNYLLVGSDSRAFVTSGSADESSFGTTSDSGGAAGHADTIIVVHVDPRTKRAAMLSFPRDLWIPIAGTGHRQRINTALSGGPERVINTIRQNFGIKINHYVQVDFRGFEQVVEAVGGVTVYLAAPVRDWDTTVDPPVNRTGLHVMQTGCVKMNGTQALAYVRSRHFQTLGNDGRWHSDGRGDFARTSRQQDFIRRAVKQALAKGLLNPLKLNRLMTIGTHNVDISDTIKISDVLELGQNFGTLSPKTLQQYTLPTEPVILRGSGAYTLQIPSSRSAEAERIFDVFRGVTAKPAGVIAPSAVTVRVLNGSGRIGEAGAVTNALGELGFGTATAGDTSRTARTVVRYPAGQEAQAALVARYVAGGADLQEVHGVSGVDVVLVTGADFTALLPAPVAAGALTTTTTVPATTTSVPRTPDC